MNKCIVISCPILFIISLVYWLSGSQLVMGLENDDLEFNTN